MVNTVVVWLHILAGPCWCMYVALFESRLNKTGEEINFHNIKIHGTNLEKMSKSSLWTDIAVDMTITACSWKLILAVKIITTSN